MPDAASDRNIPRHIAIIMDGNGRWAEARGLSRIEGHKAGAEAAQRAVEAARDMGVKYVTLFSFSSENWNRPQMEVEGLMNLLRFHLKKETAELHKSGARLLVIGDRARLAKDISDMIAQAEEVTKGNTGLTVIIALSYGGRQDISFAAREIARAAKDGRLDPETVNEDIFSQYLMTKGVPDPDLMIRTGGENRISNFLLWQMAYAELFFTDTYWPDFSAKDMQQAVDFYAARERRFGGIKARAVTK